MMRSSHCIIHFDFSMEILKTQFTAVCTAQDMVPIKVNYFKKAEIDAGITAYKERIWQPFLNC